MLVHQSIPLIISPLNPSPLAFNAFIDIKLAPGATPIIVLLPAAIPDTWVPWPLSSIAPSIPASSLPPLLHKTLEKAELSFW